MILLTRTEAGRRIAAGLAALVREPPVVMALSRSGARVADEVAGILEAPLDMVCARRLEVPGRPHSVFGAVANGVIRVDEDVTRRLGLPNEYVDRLAELAMQNAEEITRSSRGGLAPLPLGGFTVVLVDDGCAEPVLVEAAIGVLREKGVRRLVFAAPSWSVEGRTRLAPLVDEALILYEPEEGPAMLCDAAFAQTTATELRRMIHESRRRSSGSVVPA